MWFTLCHPGATCFWIPDPASFFDQVPRRRALPCAGYRVSDLGTSFPSRRNSLQLPFLGPAASDLAMPFELRFAANKSMFPKLD